MPLHRRKSVKTMPKIKSFYRSIHVNSGPGRGHHDKKYNDLKRKANCYRPVGMAGAVNKGCRG